MGAGGELEIISDVYLILCQSHLATTITVILKQEWGRSYGFLDKVNWYPIVGYFYGSPKARRRVRASRHCGRELDQQACKSRFGRSRTLLRRGKRKPAKRCGQWSDYCNCGERWAQASNVEKIAVVSDRKGLLHNVMHAIQNWE